MAMHDQLEVFRSAVGLERAVIEIVRNLPRNCRPEISRRLIDHVEEIHDFIREGNATRGDRVPLRDAAVKHLEKAKVLLQVLHDIGVVKHGPWMQSARLTTILGKQLYGWIK